MSIIWTLERLFEPPAAIEARIRDNEAAERRGLSDAEGDPPTFRCRLCGHEWAERYCPRCLAETMELVRGRRQG